MLAITLVAQINNSRALTNTQIEFSKLKLPQTIFVDIVPTTYIPTYVQLAMYLMSSRKSVKKYFSLRGLFSLPRRYLYRPLVTTLGTDAGAQRKTHNRSVYKNLRGSKRIFCLTLKLNFGDSANHLTLAALLNVS